MSVKILMSASSNFENYKKPFETLGCVVDINYLPSVNVADYDALVLCGGCDVNPVRYGQELNGSRGIDDKRDESEFLLLKEFLKQKKPVLGICRGHQVINVYFGGTLVQHLSTAESHQRKVDGDSVHNIIAKKGGFLHALYGQIFSVNSAHHQAVDKLGDGLVVDAVCERDGVIEAFIHKSEKVVGVQFHPERMCLDNRNKDTEDGFFVFKHFLDLYLKK